MSGIRVLVVDDDPDLADLTATYLRRAPEEFEVVTETDPCEALDCLDDDVDCIVSDYEMPEMDGLEFLEAVRAVDPSLPFILFTGRGSEEIASEAIAAGVTDYLQKGTGTDQYDVLANRIRNAVERERAESMAAELSRINEVIRDVQRGLVEATNRTEIEELACEKLALSEPYSLAWLGDPDADGEIRLRASAGAHEEYLDGFRVRADDSPLGSGPAGRAVRTGEVQVADDVSADPTFEPWREAAAEVGLESMVAVPLVHEDRSFGVVCIYAERADAFDRHEVSVLAELGETIAGAIRAVEVRRQLAERERELDFFECTVEGVGVGVAAYSPDGRVKYANDAFAGLLGGDREAVIGSAIWEWNPGFDADRMADYWESLAIGETRRSEVELRRFDGSRFPAETVTTCVEINGEPRHVGTIKDVTERAERRAELRRAERRFSAAFDDPSSFIGLLETDGTVVRVNTTAQAFAGVDNEDVRSEKFWETPWWDPYPDDELRDHLETAASGEFVRFEAENAGADGETVTLDVSLRPVTEDGDVRGLIAEGRDITERKRQERKLESQNDRLEEFAGVVSHDLRNPLNVAKGRVELARETADSEDLDAASAALERMDRLVDGVLQFARQGRVVADPEPVRLDRIVGDARSTAGVDGATVRVVDDLGEVPADRERLRTLFENLLANAVEHAGPEPTVTVGALADGGFYVADDGPGVPEDGRERVFERGFSTGDDGAGFGLPIVESVAEAHGWTVDLGESDTGGLRVGVSDVVGGMRRGSRPASEGVARPSGPGRPRSTCN